MFQYVELKLKYNHYFKIEDTTNNLKNSFFCLLYIKQFLY